MPELQVKAAAINARTNELTRRCGMTTTAVEQAFRAMQRREQLYKVAKLEAVDRQLHITRGSKAPSAKTSTASSKATMSFREGEVPTFPHRSPRLGGKPGLRKGEGGSRSSPALLSGQPLKFGQFTGNGVVAPRGGIGRTDPVAEPGVVRDTHFGAPSPFGRSLGSLRPGQVSTDRICLTEDALMPEAHPTRAHWHTASHFAGPPVPDPAQSRNRYCAGLPISHHPPRHPGSYVSTISRQRGCQDMYACTRHAASSGALLSSLEHENNEAHGSIHGAVHNSNISHTGQYHGNVHSREEAEEDEKRASGHGSTKPVKGRPRLDKKASEPDEPAWLEFLKCDEDDDVCVEEAMLEKLDAQVIADASAAASRGLLAARDRVSPQSAAEHPDSIVRLAELMEVLGPRYKTLAFDTSWSKATAGNIETQKRQKLEVRCRPKFVNTAAWHEAPGADPDGDARGAWLATRRRQRKD